MKTIAHISDLHFGRHSDIAAEALLDSIAENRPDLVAISGDFTQRARTAEFAAARRFLDRVAQPKLLVPGNHDIPLYNVFNRFVRPLRGYDRHFAPLALPLNLYRDEEIAVLGINTARSLTRKNGRISDIQLQDATNIFAPLPESVLKILVTHHPLARPVPWPLHQLAGRAVRAMTVLRQAGVRVLLSGHHHTALSGGNVEVDASDAVLVLHAGTAISTRTRGGESNSYNLLELDRNTARVHVLGFDARRFRPIASADYGFDGERWVRRA